ncbi:proline iminopeptidase-family hydrolase [Emticicia sp. SJ17W-69]|uniref:proline iminopeptidase-family hydrolase n=1 Tax=Emticicia sp. SJ17W-69 TaxID=3421657 RepID=UPI003EBED295
MKKLFFVLCILCLFTNGFSQQLEEKEGFVEVIGGRIWYKIVGKGKGTPLLLIHGGPGGNSCRGISAYSNSSITKDRPIIFYDQLGSGRSDKSEDSTLWKLPRFVDEIDALRKALHLKEVHILGSSWGGTVAVEYMLTKQPKGVKSVIFAGALLSTPIWMQDAKILLAQLPTNIQDTIKKYEHAKLYNNPQYIAATDSFYVRFLSRNKNPNPTIECNEVKGNKRIYEYMWGPTEFNCTGTLKNFDRTKRLHEIKVPVLLIAGRYDEARPETMYQFQKLIQHSKVEIIEGAGHNKIGDKPIEYTNAIQKFLSTVK